MCNEAHINTFCCCSQNKIPLFPLVVFSLHTELKAGWVGFFSLFQQGLYSFEEKLCYLGIRTCMRAIPGCSPGTFLHHLNMRETEEEQGRASSSRRPAQPPKTRNKLGECSGEVFWIWHVENNSTSTLCRWNRFLDLQHPKVRSCLQLQEIPPCCVGLTLHVYQNN